MLQFQQGPKPPYREDWIRVERQRRIASKRLAADQHTSDLSNPAAGILFGLALTVLVGALVGAICR